MRVVSPPFIFLLLFLIFIIPAQATTPNLSKGPGYTFYIHSGIVYAQNNRTGTVDYSGTDAAVVVNKAIAHNASVCGLLYFTNGIYTVNSLTQEPAGYFSGTNGFQIESNGAAPVYYAFGIPPLQTPRTTCQWAIEGESNPTMLYPPMSGSTIAVNNGGVIFFLTPTALKSAPRTHYIVGWWARPLTSEAQRHGMNNQTAWVSFRSLDVRYPDNQSGNEAAIDCSQANYCAISNVIVDTNVTIANLAYPVSGNVGMYGIAMPRGNLNGGVIDNTLVIGYGTAYDLRGENLVMTNDWALDDGDCATIGFREGAQNYTYHATHLDHLSCGETKYGITLGPSMAFASEVEITALDFEDATSSYFVPFQPIRHMKEILPGKSFGTISYSRTLAGVGNKVLPAPFDGGGGTNFNFSTYGISHIANQVTH